ncbi:MAG TPA: hypothetical protein PK528_13415, partial [Syntrophorhabdus sp.]|nr:hypothetical protein [Syntrophorhabdus sp.]
MEDLAPRPVITEQSNQPFGKIGTVRERPNGGAITVDNDRFTTQHAIDYCVPALDRYVALVISMGWPDYGEG